MIVLDTNVISELTRSRPDPAVVAWVTAQPRSLLYTTVINEAELFHGIQAMPTGRRRDGLAAAVEAMFAEEFDGRVLPLAGRAVRLFGEIVVRRRTIGRPVEAFDALIGAIALAAGASVATRDIGGFEGYGIELIDPWTGQHVARSGREISG